MLWVNFEHRMAHTRYTHTSTTQVTAPGLSPRSKNPDPFKLTLFNKREFGIVRLCFRLVLLLRVKKSHQVGIDIFPTCAVNSFLWKLGVIRGSVMNKCVALVCFAATQLAIQLQQERIQVVRSNRLLSFIVTWDNVTRHCIRGSQIDSRGLVRMGFLEREPFLTGYDS